MFTIQSFRRALFSAAILALAAACDSGDVAAPASIAPDPALSLSTSVLAGEANASNSMMSDKAPKPVKCQPHAPVSDRGLFGPRGGVLRIGGSLLLIPAGALQDTVTITGTSVGDASSTVRFQPHGLHFRKPAGLVLSGEGCALPEVGQPSILYVAWDGTVLETIGAVYLPRWKLVAAPITHFSGYAIGF